MRADYYWRWAISPAMSMTSGIGDTAWTHPRLLADRSSCFNSVLNITVFPEEGEREEQLY